MAAESSGDARAIMKGHQPTTIAVVIVALIYLPISAFSQLSGEFQGNFSLAFPLASKTNTFSFHFKADHPDWYLILLQDGGRRLEGFGSSSEVVWVNSYYHIPPEKRSNDAMIKIIPGSHPTGLREAEHFWLALLSGHSFKDKQLPFSPPGIWGGSSIVTEIEQMSDDASPRKLRWHKKPIGNTPPTGPRSFGEFDWSSTLLHIDGRLNLPEASRLIVRVVRDGEMQIATSSELTISSVAPLSSTIPHTPQLDGTTNVVMDFRNAEQARAGHLRYRFSGNELPSPTGPEVERALALQGNKTRSDHTTVRLTFWIVTLIIVLSGSIIAWRMRNTRMERN